MDNFLKSELIGRSKFLLILDLKGITKYIFTKDTYNLVDCYYKTNKGIKVAVEIKVRSLLWNTLFMEVSKYLYMHLLIKLLKVQAALYVNFIGHKCYIFELHLIKAKNGCRIKNVWANKTTAVNTNKKIKKMIEIPIKLAYILDYKENKWL